jgi:cellulase
LVYMSKVADAATADGSSSFFKIFQDTWAKKSSGSSGSDDYWGTKDLNLACGKMDFKIPSGLAAGDYLLRAEAIALHAASGVGGAQFYMTCYQITVTGGGSSTPEGSLFPGAYKATDPGIEINIYQNLATYIAPGPAVIAGGSEAVAGKAGSAVTATAGLPSQPTTSASKGPGSSTLVTSVKTTLPQPAPTSGNGNAGGCTVAKYQQCGGTGFSGCTTCKMTHARSLREICTDFELVGASGSTCHAQSGGYYSQCM